MRLNLGCGHNKVAGFTNVDMFPESKPDLVCDLEALPWPWEDNSVDEVLFNHSLEHMGQDSRIFLGIMKELYRVSKNNAVIQINVPHPRHDHFINDPTHVRIITPELLNLFNKQFNDEWKKLGISNSPFAHYLGVDFVVDKVRLTYEEPYHGLDQNNQISLEDLADFLKERNNVAREYRIQLHARK
jgi:predicted SAM-dependent methyltransferase